MARQIINIGTTVNDRSGDPLRTAFDKANQNFAELYTHVGIDTLIPTQSNNSGKFLSTNGQILSWSNVNKLSFNGAELALYPGGANNPFVVFPSTDGENIQVQGGEIAALGGAAAITAASSIVFNTNALSQLQTWTLSTDGILTFPDGSSQSTAYTGSSTTNHLTNGSYTLTLDAYGVVNVPLSQFNTAQVFAPNSQTLMLGNSSHYVQVRGSDGAIVFPDYSVQSTAYTGSGDGITYASALDAYSNDFTITNQQLVMVYNNGVASRTITLPANPTNGQTVTIKKSASFTSWTVVVDGNGKNIDGAATLSFNNSYGYVTLVYTTTHSYNQWFIVGGNYASV